jgi:[ribosomal protein S5]-alanine N-acetyltransferase
MNAEMRGTVIDTERLRLTPLERGRASDLHALWIEPEVRRHLWDDQIVPLSQTEEIVQRNEELFARSGFGLWAIAAQPSKEICGFAGFWHFREPPELELILGLRAQHWGKGFASEAGTATIRYGFEALGFDRVRGSADVANARSIRLMERLGMRFDRRQIVAGLDTVFYEVRAPIWNE